MVLRVPATVLTPAHAGVFGMVMFGRRMQLCLSNAWVIY